MKEPKLEEYKSPRITSEFADCSLPITFDTYSHCGHDCAYCFTQYIRGVGPASKNYNTHHIKAVNVERVKKIFRGEIKVGFSKWLEQKRPVQWGGLSDPFCPLEKRYGRGLELMKFFNEIKYPISFSSKGDLPITDERYLNEFRKAGDLWHFKASIITLDEEKAKLVENRCPSPQRRVEVLKKLHEVGTLTTYRMRPFLVGVTDKDLEEQIKTAKEVGCQSITTEFFCLETRGFGRKETLDNYRKISKATGLNLIDFYKKYGTGSGYKRLKYDFVKPYVRNYINLCKKYDLKYFISDAFHKEKGCEGSCCGMLPENKHFNYAKQQMTHLILRIKEKGSMTLDEAKTYSDDTEKDWRKNTKVQQYMNLGGRRSKAMNMTYEDYFEKRWNEGFFERYFNGSIKIAGKDKKGNAIYIYNYISTQL